MRSNKPVNKYYSTKSYWQNRAQVYHTKAQATTNDFYLREIEIRCLIQSIEKYKKNIRVIGDIGCGNGYATLRLARRFPKIQFIGYDYIDDMIDAAKAMQNKEGLINISFKTLDLIHADIPELFDMILTDRCLINLPSWKEQQNALRKIYQALRSKGIYIMIENFMEGHNSFNRIRKQFGLEEIKVREHNLFFNQNKFIKFIKKFYTIREYENISSMYYLVSRVIYTKICTEKNIVPDYFDKHHELASKLPFAGNYGPVAMVHLIKHGR